MSGDYGILRFHSTWEWKLYKAGLMPVYLGVFGPCRAPHTKQTPLKKSKGEKENSQEHKPWSQIWVRILNPPLTAS